MVSFIHTADLHLDTPFSGLSRWDGERATLLKNANRNSFEQVVQVCIRERVDFLVVAGDVFNAADMSLRAQFTFRNGLEKLAQHNIKAYVVTGNHDPLNSWSRHFTLPDNTTLLGSKEVEQHIFLRKSGEAAAEILGISHETSSVKENLARQFPEGSQDLPTIALLHGNLTGQTEHEPYAPFAKEDLKISGIDYWALGHIHKQQVISEQYPAAVYPGNPQGRHFGETGKKGCYKVKLEAGLPPEMEFIPTAPVEFLYTDIDISQTEQLNLVPEMITASLSGLPEDQSYILRIALTGRTALHFLLVQTENVDAIEEQLSTDPSTGSRIFIDRLTVNTKPFEDLLEKEKAGDFTGEMFRAFRQLEENPSKLAALEEVFRNEMKASLPGKRFPKGLSDEEQRAVIDQARWMFYDQLHKQR